MVNRRLVLVAALASALCACSGSPSQPVQPPVAQVPSASFDRRSADLPRYEIDDLKGIPGGQYSGISWINNHGVVSGYTFFHFDPPQKGHCWIFRDGIIDISPDATVCTPGRINDNGDLVGSFDSSDRPTRLTQHAFVYTGGKLEDVGFKGFALQSINNLGVAAGVSFNDNHAWSYDRGSAELFGEGVIADDEFSVFTGPVNDARQTVVSIVDGNGCTLMQVFQLIPATVLQGEAPDYAGRGCTGPTVLLGPNNAQRLVYISSSDDKTIVYWDLKTHKRIPIGALGTPLALNDNNEVLGDRFNSNGQFSFWLYRPGTGVTDITTLLPRNAVTCLGFSNQIAMNTQGKIACSGQFAATNGHAYLIEPEH